MTNAFDSSARVGRGVRRAVLTGGTSPAGRACCSALRRAGFRVAAGYAPGETPAACEHAFLFDGGADGAAEPAVRGAVRALGGVDALVLIPPEVPRGALAAADGGALDHAYRTVYRASLMAFKAAALEMIPAGGGSAVLLTTSRALRARPDDGLAGALAAGLIRSMQSFALQMAPHGIRFNAVAAGAVGADAFARRLPLGRAGSWEEAAQAVLFLLSNASSYTTGAVLPCDGGLGLAGMPESGEGYGWNPEQAFRPGEKEGL